MEEDVLAGLSVDTGQVFDLKLGKRRNYGFMSLPEKSLTEKKLTFMLLTPHLSKEVY